MIRNFNDDISTPESFVITLELVPGREISGQNEDRLCVWVRAYYRMKKYGENDDLTVAFVSPRLWELKDTSSWINFHLDLDHQADKKAA